MYLHISSVLTAHTSSALIMLHSAKTNGYDCDITNEFVQVYMAVRTTHSNSLGRDYFRQQLRSRYYSTPMAVSAT